MNTIDFVNRDPLLSEFKYHFYIRKVFMPRQMPFESYVANLHKGFQAEYLNEKSIYIAQIAHVYQQRQFVDFVVGFRRDQHALKIAKQNKGFYSFERQSVIQLTKGFKIYYDQLNQKMESSKLQQQRRLQQFEKRLEKSISYTDNKDNFVLSKKESLGNISRKDQKDSRENSRSRQRQHAKKKNLIDRLQSPEREKRFLDKRNYFVISLLMVPSEIRTQTLLEQFEKVIKKQQEIVSGQWKQQQDVSCFELTTTNQSCYQKILNQGLQIDGNWLIVQNKVSRIRDTLYKYQIKVTKLSRGTDLGDDYARLYCALSISKWIVQKKSKVVNIVSLLPNEYLVTFNKKYKPTEDIIKLDGWIVESATPYTCTRDRLSLEEPWYQLVKNNKIDQ